jgi:DNA-binding transcriptional ArsR family regulator
VDRRKNRITRYYLSSVTSNESDVLGYVRHNIARQIIIFLLDHDLCTFNEIVDHTQKAPSTISWHLKRLRDSGLVSILFGNDYQLYRVINSTVVRAVIYKYKESFVDSTVNNFTEMMEEL